MANTKFFRILNLEPEVYSPKARAILESFAYVDDGPLNRAELLQKIRNYDVLIVRLGVLIDTEILAAASHLKIIVSATTGLNHIDTAEAERLGITILSLRGERAFLDKIYATAEHTWALLLALARKLPQANRHVIARGWDRDQFRGVELHGRVLGVLGMGRLGYRVACYGIAFGMKVIGYDVKEPYALPEGATLVSFVQLLAEADIISIHANYTPSNHAMMGEKEFSRMKKGALLVNTARGELIDEVSLLQNLKSGHLKGAALDVLCGENTAWENSVQLIEYAETCAELIITPHIGGCTYESMEKTEIFMAEKLFEYYQEV